jgi:AraC family transcriptional regulator of adaptative response/methylated-DNA-[protein]-cysteine methyltransferase
MHRAFRSSDPAFDGLFFTAVRTTGVFCRPSCPARKPRPERVEFFPTAREAMLAGYRPCKRCLPTRIGALPDWVSRLLEAVDGRADRRLREADLRRLGVDPARARRWFLRNYGMTFQTYCRGLRLGSTLGRIRAGRSLDDAAFDAGYESLSGFRDAFRRAFGRPPGRSRSEESVLLAWVESPLGPMLAGATGKGLCLLEFVDRQALESELRELPRRFGAIVAPGSHPHLERVREELAAYFGGSLRTFGVPLDARGAPFEERVWAELLRVPYGSTVSYAELASRLGTPRGARAVGRANGRNCVAIVIPCHRVVNASGRLGGYGGGLWRKEFLLRLEREALAGA